MFIYTLLAKLIKKVSKLLFLLRLKQQKHQIQIFTYLVVQLFQFHKAVHSETNSI